MEPWATAGTTWGETVQAVPHGWRPGMTSVQASVATCPACGSIDGVAHKGSNGCSALVFWSCACGHRWKTAETKAGKGQILA